LKSTQFWGECHVAGIYYEGRREVVSALTSSEQVVFKREPQHPHDPNAIAIHTQDGRSIGYIPRDEARRIAPLMDQGIVFVGYVDALSDSGDSHLSVNLQLFTEIDTEFRLSPSAKFILTELRKYVTLYGIDEFGIFLDPSKPCSDLVIKVRSPSAEDPTSIQQSRLMFDFPMNSLDEILPPLEELALKGLLRVGVNMHVHIVLSELGRSVDLTKL
jgi:hypothetical protein